MGREAEESNSEGFREGFVLRIWIGEVFSGYWQRRGDYVV
jgi:hypothetical protein